MDRLACLISGVLVVCFAGVLSVSARSVNENPTTSTEVHTEAFVQVLGHSPDSLTFARFARRYGKKYENEAHMRKTFKVFVENLRAVESHNQKGLSYTMGINEFSDMTWDEFRNSRLQSYSPPKLGNTKSYREIMADNSDSVVPESKNWRDVGAIGPVKYQRQCGACWAFSATGALEAAYAIANKVNISLSEQQLVDCAEGYGCSGGWPAVAFEYVKKNGGLETEDSYPYYAMNNYCQASSRSYPSGNSDIHVRVNDTVIISKGDEDELQHAVGLVQPVNVAFEVPEGFHSYSGGIYSSPYCGTDYLDHAVLVVGYGVENGMPYWLVKNSWGDWWGDKGYFKMERGKNMCGIAGEAAYPVLAN